MNKQQLASKIWESANKMRSKIEANEYKDYILGFIFYKFLSNKEVVFLENMGLKGEELKNVSEDNIKVRDMLKSRLGYFISYDNLFSTWISMKNDFDISNVRDALSAFSRLINTSHKKVYDGIFDTLSTGLSKLGDTSRTQTKAVRDLIYLINDIPMDNKQDYDVLGFIYEYLISNFAANAGKKAGEFYTPHEVSLLMSEIIAEHLKDREKIEIYDPTSGSGSLLINIGKTISKYIKEDNRIKYYAQELKQNTYNLTRMNLVMRGILPDNIITRNGDTLDDDWPYFDEKQEYSPLFVDAVVSNPPYSQNWDSVDRESDPRYKDYGLAPKSKADYAFLLHNLYHLKSDGIMTIVLPHGVLFRGNEELEIRKNLIEHNNIDAIIGLPANIFFGTPIPTIIMVLRKNKPDTNILFIDASKCYTKDGKNNKLRASDIRKIVDAVLERNDIEKFAKVVSREELRENLYNLNIPRYISSTEKTDNYDIYASMNGGIPAKELDKFNHFFDVFKNVKNELFTKVNDNYYSISQENIRDFILNHPDIIKYKETYKSQFDNFDSFLYKELIDGIDEVDVSIEEDKIATALFNRIINTPLVDKYNAYQILDDEWKIIASDLEIIKLEGLDSCKIIDPIMEIKKKGNEEKEVQVGIKGRIIPLELVADLRLSNIKKMIVDKTKRQQDISSQISDLFESISDDEKSEISDIITDDNDGFIPKEVAKKAKEFLKSSILEDTVESKIIEVNKLYEELKRLNREIKSGNKELEIESRKIIENLGNDEILEMLNNKWIIPTINKLEILVEIVIDKFVKDLIGLSNKYNKTLKEIDKNIRSVENELLGMLNDLISSDEYDSKGLEDLKKLLSGDLYE